MTVVIHLCIYKFIHSFTCVYAYVWVYLHLLGHSTFVCVKFKNLFISFEDPKIFAFYLCGGTRANFTLGNRLWEFKYEQTYEYMGYIGIGIGVSTYIHIHTYVCRVCECVTVYKLKVTLNGLHILVHSEIKSKILY